MFYSVLHTGLATPDRLAAVGMTGAPGIPHPTCQIGRRRKKVADCGPVCNLSCMDAEQPVHDPKQEQALRDAAFERAREKLAKARREDHRIRIGPGTGGGKLALPTLRTIVFTLFLAMLPVAILTLPWVYPNRFGEYPVLAAVAALPVLIQAITYVVYKLGQRALRRLDPAEQTVRNFYSDVAAGSMHDISRYVCSADLEDAPRRPPDIPLPMFFPEYVGSESELRSYWGQLLDLRPGRKFRPRVQRVRLVDIGPDLKLAFVRLSILELAHLGVLIAAFFLGVVFAPAIVIADVLNLQAYVPSSMEHLPGLVVGAVLASAAALLWSRLRVMATHKRRVRKLLVRQGDDWKLFCGDWEAWEEADLSWLDADKAPTDRPIATARASE
jgi:hypothetical protein